MKIKILSLCFLCEQRIVLEHFFLWNTLGSSIIIIIVITIIGIVVISIPMESISRTLLSDQKRVGHFFKDTGNHVYIERDIIEAEK